MGTQKKTRAKKTDSGNLYKKVLDKSPNMTFINIGGRLVYVNDKCEEIMGFTKSEFYSEDFNFLRLIHPEYRDLVKENFAHHMRGEEIAPYEYKIITKDGREFTAVHSTSLIEYEGERAILGTVTDLTEHKVEEDVLYDLAKIVSAGTGEDFFRSITRELAQVLRADYAYIAEIVPDTPTHARTLALIADGTFMENMEVDLSGTPCATVIGKVTQSYPSNVQGLFPDAHIMAMMKVEGYIGAPIFDSTGNHIGLITTMFREPVRNASVIKSVLEIFAARVSAEIARMHSEQSMIESEKMYRTLIEQANVGIIISDAGSGIILDANRKAQEMLEMPLKDIVGLHQSSLHPEEDSELYKEEFLRHAREGHGHSPDLIMVSRTGRRIPIDVSSRTIEITGKRVVQGIFRDISERKMSERELMKQQHDLERQVEFRTQELFEANRKLRREVQVRRKSEKKLIEYQKQLQSLTSQLSLIEENEKRRIATELHDCIGQTLALSKIKLGLMNKSLSPQDMAKNIREIKRLIEQTIKETRTLTFELSPPILYELGLGPAIKWLIDQFCEKYGINIHFIDNSGNNPIDNNIRFFLFQAIRELMINVIKHAEATAATIEMTGHRNDLTVIVEDDGKGFPVQSDRFKGYGLFNIRERMHHIHGKFEIMSSPGQGTRVTLVAPCNSS